MKLLSALVFLFLITLSHSQSLTLVNEYNFKAQIPKDSTVIRGHLSNGLKYFIKKNERPKKTVEMQLIVKVGSLQEEEDQLGVAHILEHMLFNGTKNFPKHKLIEYLESIGLKFGADLNAHTSFDETVYKLSIPTDKVENIDTAFQILEDWAHNALLEDVEIEAERGVVMEEYRLRQKGVFERVYAKYYNEAYAGTREVDRFPIGTEESILNFDPQRLKDFYADWYRPNLMGIVVSGDLDINYTEKKIKEHFSQLKNPENEKPIQDFEGVPIHNDKKIMIYSDPEITSSSIYISFLDKEKEIVNGAKIEEQYASIKTNLLKEMLNQRFVELANKQNPPFILAKPYKRASLVANQFSFGVNVRVAENKIKEAIKSVYTELERVKQYGFTKKELLNAQKNMLSNNETDIDRKNERYSKQLVYKLLSEFKNEWALTKVDWIYEFNKKAISQISLNEITEMFTNYYHSENQNVLILTPQKAGVNIPKKKEILEAIVIAEKNPIKAYKDAELASELLEEKPVAGNIILEKEEGHQIKKLILSNGVEVYYKKTNFDTNYMAFKAFSYGGTSLLSDNEAKSIGNVQGLLKTTGVGGFKNHELKKVLAGKSVKVNSSITEYDENLQGTSKVDDMESLFQLIYLNFTSPNYDEDTYRLYADKVKEIVKNNDSNPGEAFSNSISNLYNKKNPRYVNIYENNNFSKILDSTSYNKSFRFFKERFANANDFKFFFVGDFDENMLKTHITSYIASLPSSEKKETAIIRKTGITPSRKEFTMYKGIADKATLKIFYQNGSGNNNKEKRAMHIFGSLLQRKLRDKIREEKAGTYGVSASFKFSLRPIPRYRGFIGFQCDPKNIETLKNDALQVVDAFLKEGPSKEDIESIEKQMELEYQKNLQQNRFWLSRMKNQIYFEKPIGKLINRYNKSLSPKYVLKVANKYVKKPELIAKLLPEK